MKGLFSQNLAAYSNLAHGSFTFGLYDKAMVNKDEAGTCGCHILRAGRKVFLHGAPLNRPMRTGPAGAGGQTTGHLISAMSLYR